MKLSSILKSIDTLRTAPQQAPYLSSVVLGALLTVSFAPHCLSCIAFLVPLFLLTVWEHSTPRQSIAAGFCFGVGLFGVGISWLYISLHHFTSAFIAVLLTTCFIATLALYPALHAYCLKHCMRKKPGLLFYSLVFPISWVLFEYLRSTLFTGFPWLLLGYSQTNTILGNLAPVIGVYGLSYLVCMISACLILCIKPSSTNRQRSISAIVIILTLVCAHQCKSILWTHHNPNQKQSLQVSLIQGDIPPYIKWNKQQIHATLERYYQLTSRHWQSQLIVWPETAIPVFPSEIQIYLQHLADQAKLHHTTIVTGIPLPQTNSNENNSSLYTPPPSKIIGYYNGLITIGNGHGHYKKHHLVPFGEYLPLQRWFNPFLQQLHIPMAHFTSGPYQQANLTIDNTVSAAALICYEIAYSDQVAALIKPSTGLLIIITDDVWFGKSIALAQHLQIAEMRAKETGRYLLFDNNQGITAIINDKGQRIAGAPIQTPFVVSANVELLYGQTPWMQAQQWIHHAYQTLFLQLQTFFSQTDSHKTPELLKQHPPYSQQIISMTE